MPWERYTIGSGGKAGGRLQGFLASPPSGGPFYTVPTMVVKRLDDSSSALSVTNTTTETTLATLTVPVNTLSSTGGVRLTCGGTIANSATTNGTVTFRVKLTDATTAPTQTIFATSGLVCSTSTSPRRWTLETITLGKQPLVQHNWGVLHLSDPSAQTLSPLSETLVGYSTSSRDETDQISMTVTAQLSAASTGFTATRSAAFLEGIA